VSRRRHAGNRTLTEEAITQRRSAVGSTAVSGTQALGATDAKGRGGHSGRGDPRPAAAGEFFPRSDFLGRPNFFGTWPVCVLPDPRCCGRFSMLYLCADVTTDSSASLQLSERPFVGFVSPFRCRREDFCQCQCSNASPIIDGGKSMVETFVSSVSKGVTRIYRGLLSVIVSTKCERKGTPLWRCL
jgi:hypothetical protein